ncbi:MAG: nucleotidyl transferase AbiEii/AbiGii toxin family protein [Bacteroidales bacterium]|nr:nucleotidyl transferase AbiEii/AbiGii toxin family protein [Bacteroidales bacterium]
MNDSYKKQVSLLIRILPVIAREPDVALHGGTAINLFIREMPRLSVDIDLTYLPLKDRDESLTKIRMILERIKTNLNRVIPGIHITGPDEHTGESKIVCVLKGVQVKIEVNTVNRGSLKTPETKSLCKSAQKEFALYAEVPVIPLGQLYGGKICAALDRQHARDIFDIRCLLEEDGINDDLKQGFLFCLLSSSRP